MAPRTALPAHHTCALRLPKASILADFQPLQGSSDSWHRHVTFSTTQPGSNTEQSGEELKETRAADPSALMA